MYECERKKNQREKIHLVTETVKRADCIGRKRERESESDEQQNQHPPVPKSISKSKRVSSLNAL